MTTGSSIRSGLLPPPYSYERTYSSYGVEWEERSRQQSLDDVDVTDLTWLKYNPVDDATINDDDDGRDQTRYLLGCTSLGEVLVWRVPTRSPLGGVHQSTNRGCVGRSKPSCRMFVPSASPSHGKYKIAVATSPSRSSSKPTQPPNTSRKRNRTSVEEGSDVVNDAASSQDVCFVASEEGLWKIPLAALFSSTARHDGTSNVANMGGKIRIVTTRPMTHIQVFREWQDEHNESRQFLYALERDCISKWNVTDDGGLDVDQPAASYPLSHLLLNLGKKHRPPPKATENATSMLVVSDPKMSSTPTASPLALVGTDHGRVLIVPTGSPTKDSPPSSPRSLSLNQSKGRDLVPAPAREALSGCIVTSIMETHNTWWTVAMATSASPPGKSTGQKHDTGKDGAVGGVLSTWHAPTVTLVAVCPTRESVHSIRATAPGEWASSDAADHDAPGAGAGDGFRSASSTFYSIGNESVVSLWTSPYQLERAGRVWTNPPSSKALAICPADGGGGGGVASTSKSGTPPASGANGRDDADNDRKDDDDDDSSNYHGCLVAVAGIGTKVDIVLDRCCIETLQL
jgi:hypothetical protein